MLYQLLLLFESFLLFIPLPLGGSDEIIVLSLGVAASLVGETLLLHIQGVCTVELPGFVVQVFFELLPVNPSGFDIALVFVPEARLQHLHLFNSWILQV